MLTKTDKQWIEGHTVSKEELKKELGKFATKEDLKGFATKTDLAESNIRLRTEMHQIRDELKEEIRSKHDQVMTVLDKIMAEVVKGREHDLVIAHQVERLNKAVFG